MSQGSVLIVDDEETILHALEKAVKQAGFTVYIAKNGVDTINFLTQEKVDVAIVDLNLPGFSGLQVLQYKKVNHLGTELILMTGQGTVETAVSSLKMGAYDYITKPFESLDPVVNMITKACEKVQLTKKIDQLENHGEKREAFKGIVGRSTQMREVYSMIESIGSSDSSVLILGASGTGKELVSKAIHETSPRKNKPFVVINCSAMSENLLESELFGHKKGSFTGAVSDKRGLFEEANGGTAFLDEIGEISLAMQVKLLRVLQSGELRSVGGTSSRLVDVRILAATNKNLFEMVKQETFREDLFYRLNVINVTLPPLKERVGDIPILAYHFLEKYSKRMKKKVEKISIDAMQSLQEYSWVGNVRELENVIERALVLTEGETITAKDLPSNVLGEIFYVGDDEPEQGLTHLTYQMAKDKVLGSFNRTYLSNLLKQTSGNITVASDRAGMDRSNFKKILKKSNLSVSEFKK